LLYFLFSGCTVFCGCLQLFTCSDLFQVIFFFSYIFFPLSCAQDLLLPPLLFNPFYSGTISASHLLSCCVGSLLPDFQLPITSSFSSPLPSRRYLNWHMSNVFLVVSGMPCWLNDRLRFFFFVVLFFYPILPFFFSPPLKGRGPPSFLTRHFTAKMLLFCGVYASRTLPYLSLLLFSLFFFSVMIFPPLYTFSLLNPPFLVLPDGFFLTLFLVVVDAFLNFQTLTSPDYFLPPPCWTFFLSSFRPSLVATIRSQRCGVTVSLSRLPFLLPFLPPTPIPPCITSLSTAPPLFLAGTCVPSFFVLSSTGRSNKYHCVHRSFFFPSLSSCQLSSPFHRDLIRFLQLSPPFDFSVPTLLFFSWPSWTRP